MLSTSAQQTAAMMRPAGALTCKSLVVLRPPESLPTDQDLQWRSACPSRAVSGKRENRFNCSLPRLTFRLSQTRYSGSDTSSDQRRRGSP